MNPCGAFATARAFSSLLLNEWAGVRIQSSRNCIEQDGSGLEFSLNTPVFSCEFSILLCSIHDEAILRSCATKIFFPGTRQWNKFRKPT